MKRTKDIAIAVSLPAAFFLGTAMMSARVGAAGQGTAPKAGSEASVTPVSGPSWLNRLGIRPGDSSLGRSGATYGPPPDQRPASPSSAPLPVGRPVVLTGADVYRLNCQSCHRAEGAGSPPEIKSVIPAVQGSSLELMRGQLRQKGSTVSAAEARAQANRGRTELFDRIKKGGQRMPPFAHLQDADVAALYAHLTQLAGSPDAAASARRTVSWTRLGEHVVKGTCHICHDAVGVRPTGEAIAKGTIPPLNILVQERPVVDFLTKVRSGAAFTSDDLKFHYRGRMPVFSYLRDIDIAAAYTYLSDYPPAR